MLNPAIEEAKSSVDGFELPCGYLDSEGGLHRDVVVREMTGEEEEILAARNLPVAKKINKILARCTTSIGPFSGATVDRMIPDLTQGDRIYLLLAIRRASLGNDMPFITKCPACEQESKLVVDLSELEIQQMEDPSVRFYNVELPKSKNPDGSPVVVRMKVLTGRGEEAISKAANRGKDVISTAIFCRIEEFNGKPCTMNDLKRLPLSDRNFLREQWEGREGGVDTEVTCDCPFCGYEYNTELDVSQAGFFNPSAALRGWKKRSSI